MHAVACTETDDPWAKDGASRDPFMTILYCHSFMTRNCLCFKFTETSYKISYTRNLELDLI